MPELPDVESFNRYLSRAALHQRVERVEVEDARILEEISQEELDTAASGKELSQTRRHGKHLFVALNQGPWLHLHFGMTGHLEYFSNTQDRPEYTRVLFHLDGDSYLAYVSQRMLGHVGLVKTPEEYVERRNLGPDALAAGSDALVQALRRRRGRLKSTLLNQHCLAGIGNLYADEILFQCGFHPLRTVDTLSYRELRTLCEKTREVLETAVRNNADLKRCPDSYLLTTRGKTDLCPACGAELETVKVSQRTTYFCPVCQRAQEA